MPNVVTMRRSYFVGILCGACRWAGAVTLHATAGERVTLEASAAIHALVGEGHPKHHQHLRRAERAIGRTVDVRDAVKRLGNRLDHLPPNMLSFVRASTRIGDGEAAPAFDQSSIDKSRAILNGMMTDAWKRLDKAVIGCREYSEQNRAAKLLADADVSRLGGQIADAKGEMASAVNSGQEAETQMSDAKRRGQAQTILYNHQFGADSIILQQQKADMLVSQFIMKLSKCKGSAFLQTGKARSFSQLTAAQSGARICKRGKDFELQFQDRHLQQQANKLMQNPRARKLLSAALGGRKPKGVIRHRRQRHKRPEQESRRWTPISLMQVNAASANMAQFEDQGQEQNQAEEEVTEREAEHEHESWETEDGEQQEEKEHFYSHGSWEAEDGAEAPAAAAPSNASKIVVGQTDPEKGPDGPPRGQWRKCHVAEVDCGLLHDGMSLLWGDMKDGVDELETKMSKNEQEHKRFMDDLNTLIESLANAKAQASTTLAEATADMNSLQQELGEKQEESRELQKEYKRHQKECHRTITEIMYTEICGVRSVRTAILNNSATTKPEKVIDCEFGDWEPGDCSVSCDNNCPKGGGLGKPCGGVQTLTRDLIQRNNALGMPCPSMKYRSLCGQVKCPIDCVVSKWSGWSACSRECEGGVRQRTRAVLTEPRNGGATCDALVETESCNTGSCDRNCKLSKWSRWSGCTAACGSGSREKRRRVLVPSRGDGKCPKGRSHWRLKMETCNDFPCQGDERCIAKTDLVVAVDGSGSLSKSGFATVKEFVKKLIGRYDSTIYGQSAVKAGLVAFGNGEVMDDGSIKQADTISQLTDDMSKLTTAAEGMAFKKGFTNMAQAFAAADKLLFLGGRKEAQSTVLVITDGKPSFKHQLFSKVRELQDKMIRVVIVAITDYDDDEGAKLMQQLASPPARSNFVWIPGLLKLKQNTDKYVTKVLVSSCSRAMSPAGSAMAIDRQGFRKIMEGKTCTKGRVLLSTNTFEPADCFSLVRKTEGAKFFSVGTRWNEGKCWGELTKKADCSDSTDKFKVGYSDFYQIENPG